MLEATSTHERKSNSVMSFTVAISIFIFGGFALFMFQEFYFAGRRDLEGEGIFLNVPSTNYPDKYSEGLFFWTNQDGNSQSSLEYHVERGGDPEVFWAAMNEGTLK